MIKSYNDFKAFIGFCLILFQATNSWCQQDSPAFMVQIYVGEEYRCGGTLVKENFVITSAECIGNDSSVLTVKGNDGWRDIRLTESSVIAVFKPQDYNETTGLMDVAVLKLEKSIIGEETQTAELCSTKSVKVGEPLTVYYWLLFPSVPKFFYFSSSELIVSDKETCAKIYNEDFNDTMFCATDPKYGFPGSGGPGVIDGKFCAIHSYKSSGKLIAFTSLANPKVKQFIEESLEK